MHLFRKKKKSRKTKLCLASFNSQFIYARWGFLGVKPHSGRLQIFFLKKPVVVFSKEENISATTKGKKQTRLYRPKLFCGKFSRRCWWCDRISLSPLLLLPFHLSFGGGGGGASYTQIKRELDQMVLDIGWRVRDSNPRRTDGRRASILFPTVGKIALAGNLEAFVNIILCSLCKSEKIY